MQVVEKFALTLENTRTSARNTLYPPLCNPRNKDITIDVQQTCCPYCKFSIQR
jgi:hypothetical protein